MRANSRGRLYIGLVIDLSNYIIGASLVDMIQRFAALGGFMATLRASGRDGQRSAARALRSQADSWEDTAGGCSPAGSVAQV
jgi:hypothetical protein